MYKIGISSGFWSIARAPELFGFTKKIFSGVTHGVNLIQLDLETISEFFEPNFIEVLKEAQEKMNLEWSIHGEIGSDVAWDSALEIFWLRSQRRLHEYLDTFFEIFVEKNLEKYKPLYINFHISVTFSIIYFAERYRLVGYLTVDPMGRRDWTEILNENPELKYWFIDNFLFFIARESGKAKVSDYLIEIVREYVVEKLGIREGWEEKVKEIIEKIFKEGKIEKDLKDFIFSDWQEVSVVTRGIKGVIEREDIAYALIFKYLEIKKDDPKEPIWKIFFGNKSLKDLEEKDWAFEGVPRRLVNKETGEIYLNEDIIAAVTIRYILGHFMGKAPAEYLNEKESELKKAGKEMKEFYKKTALEKMQIVKILFTFENPELERGELPGKQRIIKANHMYYFVKSMEKICEFFGFKNFVKIWIDPNHWQHNKIDTEEELRFAPSDFGKYVAGVHIYYPGPFHEHVAPIEIGFPIQETVYKYLYILREKGFKEGVIIIEIPAITGRTQLESTRSSVIAIRKIVEELEKNTSPEKLPLEFYGVEPKGIYSFERQLATIKEHFFDPLKGLLKVPEEEYTFLGKFAIEELRKRPEEWKKEELR